MQKILIVGANSGMAEAVARLYAKRGAALHLLGRSPERLEALAADLRIRGAAQASHATFDARALDTILPVLDDAIHHLSGLDLALIAHGTLPDQAELEQDLAKAQTALIANGNSAVLWSQAIANAMARQGHGTLAVISSVAGERGRQSNYIYGSAKAMVTAFSSGLRNRYAKQGVHVVTLKPGFVATAMTAHLKQGPLFASADKAAQVIVKAMDKKKDVAYVPGFWWLIMGIIKAIPEGIFKKLKL
jgi:short-subunit dehydrogenase